MSRLVSIESIRFDLKNPIKKPMRKPSKIRSFFENINVFLDGGENLGFSASKGKKNFFAFVGSAMACAGVLGMSVGFSFPAAMICMVAALVPACGLTLVLSDFFEYEPMQHIKAKESFFKTVMHNKCFIEDHNLNRDVASVIKDIDQYSAYWIAQLCMDIERIEKNKLCSDEVIDIFDDAEDMCISQRNSYKSMGGV